ncbi:MAG: YgiQ family radical SAM protein [Bacteroidetes bacterium HGW-Bacteroidetes-6]|jgi:uncharacterized radical SAM protein YgiQ|nr:MAG: YgiQ family radical SAM protein [Bacteroidetes bacterium HGW-Bacteroidetes-6]
MSGNYKNDIGKWLPATTDEMRFRGWEQPDIVLITGDAYVDHPAFGIAIIGRVLEEAGYKVVIIAQPNWRDDLRDFRKFGQPRLFFGISGGNMDSMVNHYTARKRLRSDDAYTPGDRSGFRPDYATTVYSKMVKQIYPDTPVIIGGIEASLRRLTHYDYWSDSLKPSVLVDSGADLLVYGMGEKAIVEAAKLLDAGENIQNIEIPQTAIIVSKKPVDYIVLPSYEDCLRSKTAFGKHFTIIETESNRMNASGLVEPFEDKFICVRPPYKPISTEEIDKIYALPYTRLPHPRYNKKPPIPAYEMIRHSLTIHRGCFGGCSFCTISMQQGRFIQSRSEISVLNEVEQIKLMPDFGGTISDIGGPSANMYKMTPIEPGKCMKCRRVSCIFPSLCNNLNNSHNDLCSLYKKVSQIKGVKSAFVTSGVRYDLFLNEKGFLPGGKDYFRQLVNHHLSGRLKVAPEHSSPRILKLMRKPGFALFLKLKSEYEKLNSESGRRQQIVPYLITAHPGSTMDDTFEMAIQLRNEGVYPEQMQDFTPTPMTLSSVMHWCGFNPYDGEKVNVTRYIDEKRLNNSVLLFHRRETAADIVKAAKFLKNKLLAGKLRKGN